jgi:pimeloyl-ACP methyl ester carboxylesterase
MPSTRLVKVGETVLEAVTEGSRETVVLLPAGGCRLDYLAPFARRLAGAGFRTVAVNWRGIGQSGGPLDGLTLHHLTADIAGVIEALAAAPAHAGGHAFGNRVARCLATVPTSSGVWSCSPLADLSPASDPRLLPQVQSSPLWDAGDLTETVGQATPLADWWAGGTAPLLVVQGLDDRRAPPGNGWALRDHVGDRVRVVDIPQAGHFLVLEQPQAVAEAVPAFLREP